MERIKAPMNIMPEQLRRTQITTSTVSVDRHGVKQMLTREKAIGGNRLVRKTFERFFAGRASAFRVFENRYAPTEPATIVSSNTHEQDCVCWSSGCNLQGLQGPLRRLARFASSYARVTKPYGVRPNLTACGFRPVVMRTGRTRAAAAAADAEAVYNHDAQCP
jgi:hypothetical protein